jgi:hypothetical protein
VTDVEWHSTANGVCLGVPLWIVTEKRGGGLNVLLKLGPRRVARHDFASTDSPIPPSGEL